MKDLLKTVKKLLIVPKVNFGRSSNDKGYCIQSIQRMSQSNSEQSSASTTLILGVKIGIIVEIKIDDYMRRTRVQDEFRMIVSLNQQNRTAFT